MLKEIGHYTEITTPYLDRHNDYIQTYTKFENGQYTLTDGGETLIDLEHSGFSMKSSKRQALLKQVVNGFGLELGEELKVTATAENFPLRKHNLIQSILAVNDMFYLANPTVESLFCEDVTQWLEDSNVSFISRVGFVGKTGYNHIFDHVVPKSKIKPERVIRSINNPSRDRAEGFIMAWLDTKEARSENAMPIAILNDRDKSPTAGSIQALQSYNIHHILWSDRDSHKQLLTA
ncbi:MAG: DUF1829 domain-containing protein [Vampirovibrio sp.]|nr:DUF1829 domain-containing protein [Vampirovibrio sp.]